LLLQAEFKDINLAAYSDAGTLVDINIYRNGTHVVRLVEQEGEKK